MILIDREDVDRIGLNPGPFYIVWDLDDPEEFEEGQKADWADIPAPGPFVLIVHDFCAWAGHRVDSLSLVAVKRMDPANRVWWTDLATLYAEGMGISLQSLVRRFTTMTQFMRRHPDSWVSWGEVYHWPEGGDLAWSALVYGQHPWMEAREHEGQRQVRYTR